MAYTYLGVHVKTQALASPVTSGAIDDSGADFLAASVSFVTPGTPGVFAGTNAGSFTSATSAVASGTFETRSYYKQAPTTNAAETFSFTNVGTPACSFGVACFSGSASSPLDQTNTATTGGATSLATGSITPTENNELIIATLSGGDSTGTYTIDNGFTITDQYPHTPGTSLGFAIAYLIQTSASAINPTWSWTGSGGASVTIASYKAAAGATPRTSKLPRLGVG